MISAYDADELDLQAQILVRMKGELVQTTTGRVILGEVLPSEVGFSLVNQLMDKKALSGLMGNPFCWLEVKKQLVFWMRSSPSDLNTRRKRGLQSRLTICVFRKTKVPMLIKRMKRCLRFTSNTEMGLLLMASVIIR